MINYKNKIKNDNRSVIILGMSANGLSVARSLGRKGIPVIGIGSSAEEPAVYSRYVQEFIQIPDDIDKKDLVSKLLSLASEFSHKPVIIPTADEYVRILSNFRRQLSSHYDFLLPDKDIVDCFLKKQKTSEFCLKNNIAHPATFSMDHEDDWSKIAGKIKYPCIVKPQESHLWRKYYPERKAFVVNTREQLLSIFREIKKSSLNIMIQQIIPGPDSNIFQYLAFCDRSSNVLASFCCRKLRQYPPYFGIACLSESVNEPSISEAASHFLSHLEYIGIIALEFKIDEKTKQPVFLEANLRTSFFGELPVASGIDFPYLMFKYLANGADDIKRLDYKIGVKLWNLQMDLGCLFRLRKQKEITFLEWIKGLKAKKYAHTYFALDDLKPWFIVYWRFSLMSLSKLFGALFRKIKIA